MGDTTTKPIRILYFAWVREKIGRTEDTVAPPASVTTVDELITWLKTRGPEYEEAFRSAPVIRAAINHCHVKPDTAIAGAREIAFFPPVTGG